MAIEAFHNVTYVTYWRSNLYKDDELNFPSQISTLVEEKTEQQARGIAALRGGWAQISPLFKAPHGPWLFLMCVIHIGAMFGLVYTYNFFNVKSFFQFAW